MRYPAYSGTNRREADMVPTNRGSLAVSICQPRKDVLGAVLILSAAAVFALFLGLIAAILPWFILLPLAIIPLGLVVAWRMPELALLAPMAAAFGVIPEYLLPRLPVAGGLLRLEDAGIFVMLAVLLVRNMGSMSEAFRPLISYVWPIGMLVLLAALSAALSIGMKGVEIRDEFQELRPFAYWVWLPTLMLAVRTSTQMRRFLLGLALLTVVTSLLLMFQSFTGSSIMTKGQAMRDLYTLGDVHRGVIRTTSPASFLIVAVLMFLLASFAVATDWVRTVIVITLSLVLIGGVLVGFGRGIWFSAFLGVLLLAYFVRTVKYSGVLLVLGASISIGISILALTNYGYVTAAYDRIFSVRGEVEYGSSFDRRRSENAAAIKAITQNPILGVGLGAEYMLLNSETMAWEAGTRYIHNAYLGALLKLGPFGLVLVIWLTAVAIWRPWLAARERSPDFPVHFAALWALLAVLIFTAMTQRNIMATHGVLTICLAIFVSEWTRRYGLSGNRE